MNEQPLPLLTLKTDKPRILIVKMWALGDILMATPLLSALKQQFPECFIAWLADKEFADSLSDNPLVDELIRFDSGTWRRLFRYANVRGYLMMSLGMVSELRKGDFDIVINLTAEKWWSAWFNVAPIRIGLFPRLKPGVMGRLYTVAIPRSNVPWLHNSQHYLLPAKVLGGPQKLEPRIVVGINDRHRKDVDEFLRSHSNYSVTRPTIVIHPGTSQESKCWPPESYAQLIRRLENCNIIITGSPKEREIAMRITDLSGEPTILAAGELSNFGHSKALIDRANAVVTGDTSILHVASALDKPLVGIYGSTRPRDNAPLFGKSQLLFDNSLTCSPCYDSHCKLRGTSYMACMRGVSVDDVLSALKVLGFPIPSVAVP